MSTRTGSTQSPHSAHEGPRVPGNSGIPTLFSSSRTGKHILEDYFHENIFFHILLLATIFVPLSVKQGPGPSGAQCLQNSSWSWPFLLTELSVSSHFFCVLLRTPHRPNAKQETFNLVGQLLREWRRLMWEKSKWTLSERACQAPKCWVWASFWLPDGCQADLRGIDLGQTKARMKKNATVWPSSQSLSSLHHSLNNHLVQNITLKMCWKYATFKKSCNCHYGK